VTLRPAQESDMPAIAGILRGWYEETPYVPRLHTAEEDRGFVTGLIQTHDVMVHEDDAVDGFIARQGSEIGHLYLAPAARGKGIGSALLALMQAATDHLTLWCFQQNTGARRFYERHGFTAAEMTDGSQNEEGIPDIRYVWRAA